MRDAYGIVLAKDVMVRDARRDRARDRRLPARTRGRLRPRDAFRRSSAARPTTARTSATPRSPTSSSRTGTRCASRTCATGTESDGTGEYFHTVDASRRARTATTRSSGSRRSRGRTGASAPSARRTRGSRRSATALESPPHLAAIWPDVVPTNSFQHQSREGGAMQLHMFWALFIHAQDAQDIADDRDKQARGLGRPDASARALLEVPLREGRARAAPRADARAGAPRLHDARHLRRATGRRSRTTSRATTTARGHARHVHDRLVRRLSALGHRVLRGDGGEEHDAAAADRRPVEPRRHARRRDWTLDVDFGPDSVWGVEPLLRRAAALLRRATSARTASRSTTRRCGSS